MYKLNRHPFTCFTWLRPIRRRTLALSVCLITAVTVVATQWFRGPEADIDSLSDAGDGKITVSWSLSMRDDETYGNDHPEKVCIYWYDVENSEKSDSDSDCPTDGMANQDDITIDTGIGSDSQPTTFAVSLVPYYDNLPMYGADPAVWVNVTLNASE